MSKKKYMIQRIQTLYLLLIFMVYLFFYVFAIFPIIGGIDSKAGKILLFKFSFLIFFVLTSIFLYKKRKKQIIINKFLIVNQIAVIFLLFINYFKNYISLSFLQLFLWLGISVFSIFLFLLANRAIRKDERLVASINRLR